MITRGNVLSDEERKAVRQIARREALQYSTPGALRILAQALLRIVEVLEQHNIGQPPDEGSA